MHRAGNLSGYTIGNANDTKEDGDKENASGNHKQTARERSQRAGNLDGYMMGMENYPKEDEEEEKAAGNCKQPERNLVEESQIWGNKNAPPSTPHTLGIPRGAFRILKKQATTLPAEGNVPRSGITEQ